MLVVGVSGSPRAESNSEILLRGVLEGAAAAGASVELVRLRQLRFSHCLACGWCHETGECRLADGMQGLYARVEACDVLVVASPIQFGTVSALTKAFVERFQCFWAAKYVLGRPRIAAGSGKRLGGVLVSALDRRDQFECASLVLRILGKVMNMAHLGHLSFPRLEGAGEVLGRGDLVARAEAWGSWLVRRDAFPVGEGKQ